jgi:tetratricopeptide (TPR) repeat protein
MGNNEKYTQAVALYRRMLEICRRTRGEEDELTLNAMSGLAAILGLLEEVSEGLALQERVLEIRRKTKGPRDDETLSAMNSRAILLRIFGKLKEAEPLLREAVEANNKNKPDDPGTLIGMSNYTTLLSELSRTGEADDWATRSMDAHLRVLKLKHPRTQEAVGMAVAMKIADEKYDEALTIADRALEQARRELGPDDPVTINYMKNRVVVLRKSGNLAEAGSTAEEVLAAQTRKLGPEDPGILEALASLADIRRHQGATEEARRLFATLRDAAPRVLEASKKKQATSLFLATLSAEVKWADVLSHNLRLPGRSDRSQFPPGVPGGPPRIDAPFQARSPTADGRIEPGEYGDGQGFSFDFSKDPNPGGSYLCGDGTIAGPRVKDLSDLSVQMHTVHTSQSLFLAFRVRDQSVVAHPGNVYWQNDSIEVYLDGDRVANDWTPGAGWGNREGFQVQADVLGAAGDSRWKAGTSRTADGYIIEFEIPLDLIDTLDGPGFRPAKTGSELRMNVDILDYDEALNNQSSYGVLWCEDREWSLHHGGEDFWPVALRLTPAPAPHR